MINKYLLIILLISNVLVLSAQVGQKYLEGAVPEVGGKVTFAREFNVDANISTEQMFKYAVNWANEEYEASEESKERILLERLDENYIVCQGDRYLVFSSSLLSLDRARVTYHLVITVKPGKYLLEVRNIKYGYIDFKEEAAAEEVITDKIALNKSKTKLNRYYDKFRKATIDHVDEIEKSFRNFLTTGTSMSGSNAVGAQLPLQQPVPVVIKESSASPSDMPGYKQMNASELSESIMAMFKDNWVLVVDEKDDAAIPMIAAWSGVGNFGGKPVSMVLANSENNEEEVYTISFYTQIHKGELDKIEKGQKANLTPITTPSGAVAYSEAWMIIECKKVLEQPASKSMIEGAQSKAWSRSDFNKLLMGEVVNVWAR